MGYSDQFFKCIGVTPGSRKELSDLVQKTGIPASRLKYYNAKNIVPSGADLETLIRSVGISELELSLRMGRIDHLTSEVLQENATEILALLNGKPTKQPVNCIEQPEPVFSTSLGKLYQGDCISTLKEVESDSVDLVFADPPFNLDKLYPSQMDDNLKVEEYLKWSEEWLKECIRTLKPGGALFLWNLPLWNSQISNFLHSRLTFRHWITTDIKYSLPIQSKLYPSHYSLLYFIKGEKPNYFGADRLATPTCPKCFDNLRDYGGYKHKMNPKGVSMTDVWVDIPPVRHAKYKKRIGANELPVKLLDRVIEMASQPGDLVLDPFGGSGTTYAVAEIKGRRWWGCELGPCEDIKARFHNLVNDEEHLANIRENLNHLFTPPVKKERERLGLWTAESVAKAAPVTKDMFD
jgi:site-specific DNA-methyltransferase (adenine-specific)